MTVHGTSRGYQYAKCRCELCRQWMRDAAKVRRDKARAAQPSQWIAPEPVAAHIRTQLDNGWPANAVAKAAGVTNKVIYAALAGKATKMSTATAGSRTVIERWMDDTDREAGHVISADMGVLVVKRRGKARAEHWPAYLRADDYDSLQDGRAVPRWSRQIVTVQWGDLVALMVEAGY